MVANFKFSKQKFILDLGKSRKILALSESSEGVSITNSILKIIDFMASNGTLKGRSTVRQKTNIPQTMYSSSNLSSERIHDHVLFCADLNYTL